MLVYNYVATYSVNTAVYMVAHSELGKVNALCSVIQYSIDFSTTASSQPSRLINRGKDKTPNCRLKLATETSLVPANDPVVSAFGHAFQATNKALTLAQKLIPLSCSYKLPCSPINCADKMLLTNDGQPNCTCYAI